ncbi:uncharacterized protein LOC106063625 [Biomphalaria glabrata]|uniref:Uncharacterized protein LOC106063625 n=1 Tax=Biomphalaria glabrata TaxID=6526 RepID=A0A9W3B909_BIOGL|nr:uncharacterized protein LOC106063625 [Biomphalaria glabrata]
MLVTTSSVLVISFTLTWGQDVMTKVENREQILRFLYLMTGLASGDMYDSKKQATERFHQIVIPIEIPLFYPNVTLLYEEGYFDELMMRQVVVLRDGHDGFIYGTAYNFTGMDKYRFGEFNVSVFQDLKPEDYLTSPDCDWIVQELFKNVFYSVWPYCQKIMNNYLPAYFSAWSCGTTALFIKDDPEYRDHAKPIVYYTRERYPLLPYMFEGATNVQDPCDDVMNGV